MESKSCEILALRNIRGRAPEGTLSVSNYVMPVGYATTVVPEDAVFKGRSTTRITADAVYGDEDIGHIDPWVAEHARLVRDGYARIVPMAMLQASASR
jgi:hypothetical protein